MNPSRSEICNGIDDNCIDGVDEGVSLTFYTDNDGDGYGDSSNPVTACSQPSNAVYNDSDCNDSASSINPSQIEVCDGIDNDCDSNIDDADNSLNLNSAPFWFSDGDNDGYGNPSVFLDNAANPMVMWPMMTIVTIPPAQRVQAPLKAAMALTMIVTTASTKPTPPVAQPTITMVMATDMGMHPTHNACVLHLETSM